MILNKYELIRFVKEYPSIQLTPISTIDPSLVSCNRPVPTICGATVYCHYDDQLEVEKIINEYKITEKVKVSE